MKECPDSPFVCLKCRNGPSFSRRLRHSDSDNTKGSLCLAFNQEISILRIHLYSVRRRKKFSPFSHSLFPGASQRPASRTISHRWHLSMFIWTQPFTLRCDENNDAWHARTPEFWRQSQRAQTWLSPNVNISSETDGGIARRATSYEERICSERSSIEVSLKRHSSFRLISFA